MNNEKIIKIELTNDSLQNTDVIVMHKTGKTFALKKTDGMQVMLKQGENNDISKLMINTMLTSMINSQYNIN